MQNKKVVVSFFLKIITFLSGSVLPVLSCQATTTIKLHYTKQKVFFK